LLDIIICSKGLGTDQSEESIESQRCPKHELNVLLGAAVWPDGSVNQSEEFQGKGREQVHDETVVGAQIPDSSRQSFLLERQKFLET